MTLTNKISLSILFITTLVVSIFTYLQINEQSEILNSELKQRIALIKNNLQSNAKNTIISLKYDVENDIAVLNFSHIDALFQNLITTKKIDGVFLFNADKNKALFAGKEHLKKWIPKEEHEKTTLTDIDDNHFVIATPINLNSKWGELYIIYSLQELQEEIRKTQAYKNQKIESSIKHAIFTSLLLALTLLMFSYIFAKRLIAPIELLTQTAKEIANGNLAISETLKSIHSNDEIGVLSASFIDMSQKLDTSYKTLNIANQNLEHKTIELQELNSFLEERVAEKVAQIREQEAMMISQSRLAAMGEMMSMIAHQWRQPLATASLMITNVKIKSMLSGKAPTESDEILDQISNTIAYLSGLIDNFQTYFKPNKLPENVSAQTLIEHMENILQTRLKLEKVSLHIEQEEQEVIVETYANEVVQVLINIINNAIDAQKEQQIEDRHIWLHVFDKGANLVITVEDNAGGIEKKIIKHVFDPYFSTKAKNGTGLGLYMAKMIIEKHIGGLLSVRNTAKGAEFTMVIPKKFQPQQESEETVLSAS